MFRKFVSNVPSGTGTNYILDFGESRRIRVRAYLRVEMPGTFDWRIFYINSVNSTFAGGEQAYRGLPGGDFKILSARIADGGPVGGKNVYELAGKASEGLPELPTLENAVELTFDKDASRIVHPDERIESDAVRLTVQDGHYLAFEWELEGNRIPCTPDSRTLTFVDTGDGFKADDSQNAPLPAMFACDRPYKKRVAFIGDSITQGCGTTRDAVEMWAGRIAGMMPENAVWNLGLGFGRGSDTLFVPEGQEYGSWLWKAVQNDVIIVAFGTNDLISGSYHKEPSERRSDTAGEYLRTLSTLVGKLKNAGIDVIIATLPPFSYSEKQEDEWRAVNLAIPALAAMYGCRVYDIQAALDPTHDLGNKYPCGAHPDGHGGEIAAEYFRERFLNGGIGSL